MIVNPENKMNQYALCHQTSSHEDCGSGWQWQIPSVLAAKLSWASLPQFRFLWLAFQEYLVVFGPKTTGTVEQCKEIPLRVTAWSMVERRHGAKRDPAQQYDKTSSATSR